MAIGVARPTSRNRRRPAPPPRPRVARKQERQRRDGADHRQDRAGEAIADALHVGAIGFRFFDQRMTRPKVVSLPTLVVSSRRLPSVAVVAA